MVDAFNCADFIKSGKPARRTIQGPGGALREACHARWGAKGNQEF